MIVGSLILGAAFFSGPTLTGLASVIFAAAAFVTAVSNRRSGKRVERKVDGVADAQTARVEQLGATITDAGGVIPERPEPVA